MSIRPLIVRVLLSLVWPAITCSAEPIQVIPLSLTVVPSTADVESSQTVVIFGAVFTTGPGLVFDANYTLTGSSPCCEAILFSGSFGEMAVDGGVTLLPDQVVSLSQTDLSALAPEESQGEFVQLSVSGDALFDPLFVVEFPIVEAPEPASVLLLSIGVLALIGLRYRIARGLLDVFHPTFARFPAVLRPGSFI
jgi:hypothetical protein